MTALVARLNGTNQAGTNQTGTNQTETNQTETNQTGTSQTGTSQTGTNQTSPALNISGVSMENMKEDKTAARYGGVIFEREKIVHSTCCAKLF